MTSNAAGAKYLELEDDQIRNLWTMYYELLQKMTNYIIINGKEAELGAEGESQAGSAGMDEYMGRGGWDLDDASSVGGSEMTSEIEGRDSDEDEDGFGEVLGTIGEESDM